MRSLYNDLAKSEINPHPDRLFRLGHAMPPMVLAGAAHDQQTAVRQFELEFFTGCWVPKNESPCGAERYGADDRVAAEFGFVVGVEANRVAAVAVEVEEQAVPICAGGGLDAVFDVEQFARPGGGVVGDAGIAVGDPRIGIPVGQTRKLAAR
jgi:hypothetical protein